MGADEVNPSLADFRSIDLNMICLNMYCRVMWKTMAMISLGTWIIMMSFLSLEIYFVSLLFVFANEDFPIT
jgi:hypothetical protein